MLSKFYSILIGIVIALTVVGLVFAGVTKIRQSRTAVVPEAAPVNTDDQTAPVPVATVPSANNDAVAPAPAAPSDLSATIKGSVGIDVKIEAPQVHNIVITETNFKLSPAQVTVKKGELVHMTLKTGDGVHNLFLAGYDLRTEVKKAGEVATLDFTADKSGTFDMWCEVGSHKALGMTGKFIVE